MCTGGLPCLAQGTQACLPSSVWAAMHTSHGLGSINSEHLFLTVLEAGKSKIKVPAADSVPGEGLLPGSQVTLFSQRLHLMEGGEDSSDSFYFYFFIY